MGAEKLQTPHASRRTTRSRERRSRDHCPGTGRAPTPASPRTGQAPDPGRARLPGFRAPPSLSRRAGDADAAGPAPPELTTAEWAALQQLADASTSVVSRWHVGRTVALALIRHGLVHSCSDGCGSREAGRRPSAPLLDPQADQPSGPKPTRTPDDGPANGAGSGPVRSDHQRLASPEDSPGRPCSQRELPRGVLLRDPRLVDPRVFHEPSNSSLTPMDEQGLVAGADSAANARMV